MPKYIALLRGINVSGHKKILMKDLRQLLENHGFKDVVTYIQSGNVVFNTSPRSAQILEEEINKCIEEEFGFDVPVIIRTRTEIAAVLDNSPYKDPQLLAANKIGYVLFKQLPKQAYLIALNKESYKNEEFTIIDKCGYLVYHKGAGNAKLNNNMIERKLKINATARNHRTMLKLLEISVE